MEEIRTNDEFLLIKLGKTGFVLNERPEIRKVHHISCEAVHAMTTMHPKYFSKNRKTAKDWLDRRFGAERDAFPSTHLSGTTRQ